MKTLKYFAIAALIVMTACFEGRDNKMRLTWVAFDESIVEVLENSPDPVDLVVAYSGPLRSDDITVNYTVSEQGAIEGADFTYPALSGSIVIPAGQATATLRAVESLIDNDGKDGERLITFTIESAGDLSVGFPGPDANKKSAVISIVDNDCDDDIPKIVRWIGALHAIDEGFSDNAATGKAGNGLCGGVLVVEGDLLDFGLNASISIELTQDSPGSSTGTAKVAKGVYFTNSAYSAYEYEAIGVYDEETREIALDYTFYNNDGSVWFTGVHIITP